jgi:hypothetical protein
MLTGHEQLNSTNIDQPDGICQQPINLKDISLPTYSEDSVGWSIALPRCNYEQGSPIAQTARALSRESPRRASQEEDDAPGAL